VFALGGEEFRPGDDLGVLLEQRTPLALSHPSPDAELDAVVQCVGSALGDHRAVAADDRGLSLGSTADEQFVGVGLAAARLGNPRDPGFGFGAVD
jgi:hypothetical protein